MSNLNLKEASLLDASGELSRYMRRELMARISSDSAAQQEYHETQENFALLSSLPIPEPSAAERQAIPARLKRAVHRALHQHEKQAAAAEDRRRGGGMLLRYATGGLAVAACVAMCVGMLRAQRDEDTRLRQQVARIEATINRVAAVAASSTHPTAWRYETIQSNTSAQDTQRPAEELDQYERQVANRLAALTALSAEGASGDAEEVDLSAPAGSY